jgi:Alpha/beta hydrolase domain
MVPAMSVLVPPGRRLGPVLLTVSFLVAALPAGAAAAAGTAGTATRVVSCIPSVQGPVPSTATSAPHTPVDLQGPWPSAPNYVQEEFFVSCTALGQPYTTRILLRRPRTAGQFSGTVVTEVPDGPVWTTSYQAARYELSAGIVSVIVESVPAFVEGLLKPADPARYAALHMPNAPGISAEIEGQIGALLRSRHGVLPAGFAVRHVIFAGFSGSAAEVRGYIAAEHAQVRLPGGRPIYDGFFPQQTAVSSASAPIPDLDVPVIEIQGEREVINTFDRIGQLLYRRPDGPRYRLYEVPALPHVSTRTDELEPFSRNWVCRSPLGTFAAADPTIASQFSHSAIADMGLRNLVRWVATGVPAPRADRIALDGQTVVRDRFGNAAGGVRSSYLDVPFASYAALSAVEPTMNQPGTRCDMIGYQFRLSDQTLRRLYPTHAAYVRAVAADLTRLVRRGWVTPHDAALQLAEAAHAAVP